VQDDADARCNANGLVDPASVVTERRPLNEMELTSQVNLEVDRLRRHGARSIFVLMRDVPDSEVRFRLKLGVQALSKRLQLMKDLIGPADRQQMAQRIAVDILFDELTLYTFTAPGTPIRTGDRMAGE
jgi:hypothetical protein